MKRIILLLLACVILSLGAALANPDKAVFVSSLIYRGDGLGAWDFKDNGSAQGVTFTKEGEIFSEAGGTFAFTRAFETQGEITSLTAAWEFSGQVTLEVSATGNTQDYVPVVNGVPLVKGKFPAAKQLIWKAAFAAQSSLKEVKITYTDASGVTGSWGTPELSGFMFRKPVYIKGPKAGLFNYQLPLVIGESAKVKECDFHLNGVIQSDFSDVRFTLSDQETLIPYWREEVTGKSSQRKATFWLKIPQIPEEGLVIYLYYGNAEAKDLSDGKAVFDFFDDFSQDTLDAKLWKSASTKAGAISPNVSLPANERVPPLSLPANKGVPVSLRGPEGPKQSHSGIASSPAAHRNDRGGILRLQAAKVTAVDFQLNNAVLEYKAKSGGAFLGALVRVNSDESKSIAVCSSATAGSEHYISEGNTVKASSNSPIAADTFYQFRVLSLGNEITFQRYNQDGTKLESETKYSAADSLGPIGLFAAGDAPAYYDWVRVRQYADKPAQVDAARTKPAAESVPNLASFQGVSVAENGDLELAKGFASGEYISALLRSSFGARIIRPSWKQGAGKSEQPVGVKSNLAVDISAKEYAAYKQDCINGAYYYAAKKDFTEGNSLRWRVRIPSSAEGLAEFSLEYLRGVINLLSPQGKDIFPPGSKQWIKWDATGYGANYPFNIAYSTDGGLTYIKVADKVVTQGRYEWALPEQELPKVLVKVSDAFDEKVFALSGEFAISAFAGAALEQEKAALEQPLEENQDLDLEKVLSKEKKPGAQLYDVLIKLGDNKLKDTQQDAGSFKEGDIVIVVPSGKVWSETEQKSFLIVQLALTPEEAAKLTQPKEIDTGKIDADGRAIMRMEKMRAKRIDPARFGLGKGIKDRDDKLEAIHQELKNKPVSLEVVESK